MHLEWDLPKPLAANYHLTSVMRGVRRSIGDQIAQKLPISPDILLRIFSYLDVSDIFDANVWAICLVLFHALLRKSSVLPTRVYPGHNYKVLSRGDVTFSPAGMCLNIRHTKTIQYGERSLTIPIPRLEGHVLCPVQATFRAFQMTPLRLQAFPVLNRPSRPVRRHTRRSPAPSLTPNCGPAGLEQAWIPPYTVLTAFVGRAPRGCIAMPPSRDNPASRRLEISELPQIPYYWQQGHL